MFRLLVFFTVLLFLSPGSVAQNVSLSGQVYGFNSDKVLLIKKASKNLGFEGPLENVKVVLVYKGVETVTKTDNGGFYSVVLKEPGDYELKFSKEGSSFVSAKLVFAKTSKTKFTGCNFLLKRNDNSQNELGDIVFIQNGQLGYVFKEGGKNKNPDVIQSNKILLDKSVEFNNSNKVADPPVVVQTQIRSVVNPSAAVVIDSISNVANGALVKVKQRAQQDSVSRIYADRIKELTAKFNTSDTSNISDLKGDILKLNEELSKLEGAGENVSFLKQQIADAESKIKMKEDLITGQRKSLESAKKVILYTSLFAGALGISALLVLWGFVQKRKHTTVLKKKNDEIGKMNQRLISSFKYASVIQSNLSTDKNELQLIFQDSFILNKPKDFLSGDFFWTAEVRGTIFVAVADCTGHGVPGALLSVLGQRFLKEMVEENNESSPAKIISSLESKFIGAFKDQSSVEYGIELSLVNFDKSSRKLLFSSNGSGMYWMNNKGMSFVKPLYVPAENNSPSVPEELSLQLESGDCIFLSSDGFADQFGVVNGKTKKFNIEAMSSVYKKLGSGDLKNASQILESELNKWKGELSQTDDILVVGFRV
jgi:serine phosphatase RsbU (regulator of sigma subunit)